MLQNSGGLEDDYKIERGATDCSWTGREGEKSEIETIRAEASSVPGSGIRARGGTFCKT